MDSDKDNFFYQNGRARGKQQILVDKFFIWNFTGPKNCSKFSNFKFLNNIIC